MWASTEERCGIAAYTDALSAELERLGIEVDRVPVPYQDRDPDRFRETVERLNAADLVHVQHEYTFWGGIAPGTSSLPSYYRALKKPRVVTAHTIFSAAELLRVQHETRWRQRAAKQLLSAMPRYRRTVEVEPFDGAGAVIVHTKEACQRLIERGLLAVRVHVIPAGIPEPAPAPAAEEVEAFRRRFGMNGGRVVAIFGYVTPDKGYEVALEALQSLPPGLKLLIAGGTRVEREAPYLEALRSDIAARGLRDRVAITGYLEDHQVARAMAAADLVLVPHLAANGSYSVCVALSYGKPVLASDLACFREIAEQDGGVELFDVGDPHMLAERIGFLLASTGTRARLAQNAARFAAGRSWISAAEQTRRVYQGLVKWKAA